MQSTVVEVVVGKEVVIVPCMQVVTEVMLVVAMVTLESVRGHWSEAGHDVGWFCLRGASPYFLHHH